MHELQLCSIFKGSLIFGRDNFERYVIWADTIYFHIKEKPLGQGFP